MDGKTYRMPFPIDPGATPHRAFFPARGSSTGSFRRSVQVSLLTLRGHVFYQS